MGRTNTPPDLLPGTLDLLILRTLATGPKHGYGIAERLRQVSEDVLQVGESSLYPALQRLLLNGWVKAGRRHPTGLADGITGRCGETSRMGVLLALRAE